MAGEGNIHRTTRIGEATAWPNPHTWATYIEFYEVTYCEVCGIVKRRDGANSECKGAMHLILPAHLGE